MLEIRAMQAEDLEAVARTESQIFSRPWSRKGFEDALRQKETIYLVAYEKEILAGYCGLLQSMHLLSIYMKNLGLSVPVSDRIFTRNQKKMH